MLQPNKIANDEVSKLYFIDFWATWCAPCIHVSKYLTVLQKQFPEDLYIISLTEENPEKIKKFMSKHTTELAIAIDLDGETFYKNGITSLPYGILLNAEGSILWEGHPAELKSKMIAKYLRLNKNEVTINELIKFNKEVEVHEIVTYKPIYDFEYFEESEPLNEKFKILQSNEFIELKGMLSDILAFAKNSHKTQFKIDSALDKYYKMYFKKDSNAIQNMYKSILSNLNLKEKIKSDTKIALVMSLKQPKFWDTYQFELTNSSKRYDIGKMDLKADNISYKELGYVLGLVNNKPVILTDNLELNTLHDWQVHYKFFDLMKSDLYDNYGIDIIEQEKEIPLYKITKKAP